mgnify:FL=1
MNTRKLLVFTAVSLALGLSLPLQASATNNDAAACSNKTLKGVYQFATSGYNIVNGAAIPKAIIETLVFDGKGNVETPYISLSVNGNIIQPPVGSNGYYTVEADCTGSLVFGDGVSFTLQVRPSGKEMKMLQTNPNTVMQGTAEKVLPLKAWSR